MRHTLGWHSSITKVGMTRACPLPRHHRIWWTAVGATRFWVAPSWAELQQAKQSSNTTLVHAVSTEKRVDLRRKDKIGYLLPIKLTNNRFLLTAPEPLGKSGLEEASQSFHRAGNTSAPTHCFFYCLSRLVPCPIRMRIIHKMGLHNHSKLNPLCAIKTTLDQCIKTAFFNHSTQALTGINFPPLHYPKWRKKNTCMMPSLTSIIVFVLQSLPCNIVLLLIDPANRSIIFPLTPLFLL